MTWYILYICTKIRVRHIAGENTLDSHAKFESYQIETVYIPTCRAYIYLLEFYGESNPEFYNSMEYLNGINKFDNLLSQFKSMT